MTSPTSVFDQEELLHLAIDATRRGDHGAALAYLKDGAARFPDDARLAYLLGAEHAQIGLYDRAEEEFARAISLAPGLHTARFQLGLLQMTRGNVADSSATWSGLDADLANDHPLVLFKTGLETLADERIDEAKALIERGIAANDFSPELNRDMEGVLSRIAAAGDVVTVANTEGDGAGHVWLSAYQSGQSS